jgi:hypothetical protein
VQIDQRMTDLLALQAELRVRMAEAAQTPPGSS